MTAKFVIRFDDITPSMSWTKFLPVKKTLEYYGIKSVLGVVPDCRDDSLKVEPTRSDFFDFIRAWKQYGDVIAQHGYHHLYDSNDAGLLRINMKSEFSGHTYETQYERLAKGKKILVDENVWQPYFMAPSHSFDLLTIRALKKLEFTSITDGFGVYPYDCEGITLLPQLFSKPYNFGFGIYTLCLHINSMSHEQIENFTHFIVKYHNRIIPYHIALEQKCNLPGIAGLTSSLTKSINIVRTVRRRLYKN